MFRFGLRLSLRGGREAVTRLAVTTLAAAIGVALLLSVLADFHAFQASSNRPYWEGTTGTTLSGPPGPAAHADLWNYSADYYQGQTIERLDVAALGPGAPVPPGISRLPGAGQYDASPALAALLRSVPPDELGDRFSGALAGTIGAAALSGPDELVVYVGYTPAQLRPAWPSWSGSGCARPTSPAPYCRSPRPTPPTALPGSAGTSPRSATLLAALSISARSAGSVLTRSQGLTLTRSQGLTLTRSQGPARRTGTPTSPAPVVRC